MAIKYIFVNGDVEIVDAGAYWDNIINGMQREEWKNDRKQQRHTVSYDAVTYEGEEYGYEDAYFVGDVLREKKELVKKIEHTLTPLQRRRVKQLYEGMTMLDIAQSEGVTRQTIHESMVAVRKKAEKVLQNYPDKTA